jgi:hypothetical protein
MLTHVHLGLSAALHAVAPPVYMTAVACPACHTQMARTFVPRVCTTRRVAELSRI